MDSRGNLYVMYHNPCLDGVYSMAGLMLPILTKVRRDGWTIRQYMGTLEQALISLKSTPYVHTEYPQTQHYDDQTIDNDSAGFFYTCIDNLIYLPIAVSEVPEEAVKMIRNLRDKPKQSILIMIDYFGRTWEHMQFIAKQFEYLVVIDHHQTLVNELSGHPNFRKDKYLYNLEGNIFVMANMDKAACELAHDFHEQIFKQAYVSLVPHNLGIKLQQFTKYIADNDLFVLQYKETEPLQMAIMKLRFDQDARSNQLIIYQLLNMDFNFMVKKGQLLAKERNEKVEKIVKQRKTFSISKDARGYAILSEDMSILNPLGSALAIISMKSGDHNLAAIYRENKKNSKQYKVHLRSAHHDDAGTLLDRYRCDLLAEKFGGGGHGGAASFYMDKTMWRKYIFE